MKAISVRNPYAHLIMCGEKEFEFRTWQTDYRGDLLICSSANPKVKNTISGHALIVVELYDIYEVTAKNYKEFGLEEKPEGELYAWQLINGRVIKPFPIKGKLNFFEVDDNLIDVFNDENITDEEAEAFFEQYIEPLLYKGKK